MATSTWESRELPILEAIAIGEEADEDLDREALERATGLSMVAVSNGLRALVDADMITGAPTTTFAGFDMIMIRLRERGRRAVGQWPSGDPVDSLQRLLADREATTDDPAERGRIRALRDGMVDVGKATMAEILAALIKQQTGMVG